MRIRVLRESQKMTQQGLADLMGVERTTVAMWESGTNSPRADMLPPLAKILGCRIDDLFEEMDGYEGGNAYGKPTEAVGAMAAVDAATGQAGTPPPSAGGYTGGAQPGAAAAPTPDDDDMSWLED